MKTATYMRSIILSILGLMSCNLQSMHKVRGIPKAHLFVVRTLLDAYPELSSRTIMVRENIKQREFQAGFMTLNGIEIDIVDVPFSSKELCKAEQFKKKNGALTTTEMCKKLCNIGHSRLADQLFVHRKNQDLQKQLVPKIHSLLEMDGFACSATTLDLWQGILLHEGAHLLYRDAQAQDLLEGPLQQLKKVKNPSKRTMIALLEQIIPAHKTESYREHRADQESIKRTQSVAILRALSAYHVNHAFWHKLFSVRTPATLSERLDSLFAVHADGFTRAMHFAQAADILEMKLKKKS